MAQAWATLMALISRLGPGRIRPGPTHEQVY
ncbi:hypothetical protein CCACVL1_02681 [Corchorus capsularis]|uniref:Uncharacterized protein n=1 Tax=Corchorus capsularis TaxID=210143 RepID=A0A1R3K6Z8_COCAP|nr:hypothetical protein CCACVL1_02681 [Corchorus capsularis]